MNSAARRRERANLVSKNNQLLGMLSVGWPNKFITSHVRSKWPDRLLPRFNWMLLQKIKQAVKNTNAITKYREKKRKEMNRKTNNGGNARRQANVERIRREKTLQNRLAHGGHFVGSGFN